MEVLKVLFDRAAALNGYWNLYIAVSLGLLGIMASAKPFTQRTTTKVLLTLAFVAFAASNLDAIYSTNEQRRGLLTLVDAQFQAVANYAAPPSDWLLIAFHLALDLVVVLSVWLVPWRDGRAAQDAA